MNDHLDFHQHSGFKAASDAELLQRSEQFKIECSTRRSLRFFSDRKVPDQVIKNCIATAGSAPSGANQQPWHFAVVKQAAAKSKIRAAAEAEEREFYQRRAPQTWLDKLEPLGTDAEKPFLEVASHLIVIFTQTQSTQDDGQIQKHYYANESVGIATGMLICALHQAGLVTLTHTPSPMSFLTSLLGRPKTERPFLLLVAGFPADDATVPNIQRKTLDEITSWH